MHDWDALMAAMRRQKPPFACTVVELRDGEEARRARVLFDGVTGWWIDDGEMAELRGGSARALIDGPEGLMRHDADVHVHGWVKTPLEPWRMSLAEATGTVVASARVGGRPCTTADVHGLRAGEDVSFHLLVDDETGIVLRIERSDKRSNVEVRDLRVGRAEAGLAGSEEDDDTPGISYRRGAGGLADLDLEPFFEGWPVPPSDERRLAALTGSNRCIVALDGDRVVGFVTAITDGALMASLPLLEVRSGYRGRGIGSTLVRRMLRELETTYGIDVCCDPEVAPFYERLGFVPVIGVVHRRRDVLP